MADELKTIKFQLMLSEQEAGAIDDWGFKNRIRSRAEAIRRLCQIGLIFDENRAEIIGRFRGTLEASSEFLKTIDGTTPEDYTDLERKLIKHSVDTFHNMLASVLVVRQTTGIAFNLKEQGDLAEILKGIDDIKAAAQSEENQEMLREIDEAVGRTQPDEAS